MAHFLSSMPSFSYLLPTSASSSSLNLHPILRPRIQRLSSLSPVLPSWPPKPPPFSIQSFNGYAAQRLNFFNALAVYLQSLDDVFLEAYPLSKIISVKPIVPLKKGDPMCMPNAHIYCQGHFCLVNPLF